MRLAQTLAGAAVALLLLTWLAVQSVNRQPRLAQDAADALERVAASESALHRDVLAARIGRLRSYDPLVEDLANLRAAGAQLRGLLSDSQAAAPLLDELDRLIDRKEAWTEEFKSRNAQLQTSLARFALLSARLTGTQRGGGPADQAVGALATSILRLTLDASAEVAAGLDERLRSLGGLPQGNPALAGALLSHAAALRDLLPATDGLLKALMAASTGDLRERLAAVVRARQEAADATSDTYRILLYGLSLLLAACLALAGLRLQELVRSRRARARLEHAIAAISTRFLSVRREDLPAQLERALQELAQCAGADRAYLVMPREPVQIHVWCRGGGALPDGWPARAMEISSAGEADSGGSVDFRAVPREPRGRDERILAAAGVRGWLCVRRLCWRRQGPLLGFDSLGEPPPLWHQESALFRMAFDALVNAVERDLLEWEKDRLEAGLERTRRMETIGALASGVAHNFNNIIGAILGQAEMAQAQVEAGSRLASSLSEVRRAGERARDLVEQILAFGRGGEGKRQRIVLNELIAETRGLLEASLPPHARLAVRCGAEQATVWGEATHLQQVVLNLCNNAAQAMDRPGTIEISTEQRSAERPLVLGSDLLGRGRYVVVTVSDPGRGMDEATLGRLFEPFFTTRAEGNGLGLATVREIVRRHEGAVSVESAPGAGTRFEVWLPDAAAAQLVAPARPARGNGEIVMLLSTDRERRLRQEEILAALGYEPLGFDEEQTDQALHLAAGSGCDVALFCCGGWTGAVLQRAARLRAVAPELPIVLAVPSAGQLLVESLTGAGVTEVVHLPLQSGELCRAIERCLARRRKVEPTAAPGEPGAAGRPALAG